MSAGHKNKCSDISNIERSIAELKVLAAQYAELNPPSPSKLSPSSGTARESAKAGSLSARKRSQSVPNEGRNRG
jgi:hypothetical protein